MMIRRHIQKNIVIFGIVCAAFLFASVTQNRTAFAANADELREKIEEKEREIEQINKEIAAAERELQKVGAERSTLQAAIAALNVTRNKLLSEISLTQKQIEKTNLNIEELKIAIKDKEDKIVRNDDILANALRTLRVADDTTFVETVLAYDSISDLWFELDQLEQIQETIYTQAAELKDLRAELQDKQSDEQAQHETLTAFKTKLSGQKQVVDQNAKEKNTLLSVTQSKEAEYQRILAEKLKARQQGESELSAYEAQLAYTLDPSRLPKAGSTALFWPVESPTLTQGFGLTSFARSGAYGYTNGAPNPHRGIDFRASVGTPVLAAAPGTVRDAVNMDATPGCSSYGRWILVDHDNGLSSLYAHLSVMSVKAGDYVKQGQIIGYAGQSGYATGPHLHFTVFDRDAVKVANYTWSNGCKNTRIAYAPLDAYLDPLSYLPK